jgi:C4-dicarboxylate-specific signal transduction histidine kinase
MGGLARPPGAAAHEINQPLTAVLAGTRTALRLLPAGQAPEPEDLDTARQALELAAAQARRAADVLTRLRRLVEHPEAMAALQAVRLEATAAALLALLAPELRRRGVRTEVAGHAPPVWADPVALEQIIHNLVTNALQALEDAPPPAPETARIVLQVQTDAAARRARLVVRDNGPGIAPQALPRLFEPFFTTRRSGLGLGLPLCESLAQVMGGTLTASNAAPHGAEFVLELPLAPAFPPEPSGTTPA